MTMHTPHSPQQRSGIYLLIDPDVLDPARWGAVLPAVLQQPLALVQLRAKNRPRAEVEQLGRRLRRWCDDGGVPLLINDDVAVAVAIGAQGVHLGQSDGSVDSARKQLGMSAIIGRTCHDDLELFDRAARENADYASIGALYASGTKPGARPATLATLRQAASRHTLPVCAIGGITPARLPEVVRSGARLIAVCGAILCAPDPTEATRHLVRLFAHESKHTAV